MEDENPAVKTQLSGNRNYSDIRKRKKKTSYQIIVTYKGL